MHLLVSHRNETEHVRTTSYLLVAPLDRLVALAAAHVAIRGAAADEPDDWEYEGGEEATRREAPVAGATRCSARKALAARLGAAPSSIGQRTALARALAHCRALCLPNSREQKGVQTGTLNLLTHQPPPAKQHLEFAVAAHGKRVPDHIS